MNGVAGGMGAIERLWAEMVERPFDPHPGYTGPPMTVEVAARAKLYMLATEPYRREIEREWTERREREARRRAIKLETLIRIEELDRRRDENQRIWEEERAKRSEEYRLRTIRHQQSAGYRFDIRRKRELADLGFSNAEAAAIVSDERERMIARAYVAGAKTKEISASLDLSSTRIMQIKKRRQRMGARPPRMEALLRLDMVSLAERFKRAPSLDVRLKKIRERAAAMREEADRLLASAAEIEKAFPC